MEESFIPGYGEKYIALSSGHVLNCDTLRLLREYKCGDYKAVSLNGKTCLLHRVIASTFLPNPNKYPVVNHKDGNKYNNKVENLEWCSYAYNTRHAIRNGLLKLKEPLWAIYWEETKEQYKDIDEASKKTGIPVKYIKKWSSRCQYGWFVIRKEFFNA